jgi:LPS-assembly lipoprotein
MLLALLGACGFHLKGVSKLPEAFASTVVLTDDRYSEFSQALVQIIERSGSRVLHTVQAGTPVIDVLEDKTEQRVLSISASNLPTEYEVFYTVRYRVRVDGKDVLPPQVLKLSKDYSFNENAVLAKEEEQQLIRRALAQELATVVVRRLAALTL